MRQRQAEMLGGVEKAELCPAKGKMSLPSFYIYALHLTLYVLLFMNNFLLKIFLRAKTPEGKSQTTKRKKQKMKRDQVFIWCLPFAFCLLLLTLTGIVFAQEKTIEPGDVLEIVVFGHQELSRMITVAPNGTVDFPFLQGLPVNGLSLNDVREMIIAQLSKYIPERPIVTVSKVQSYAIPITVLGQVKTPGEHNIPINATIQGALAAAGGATPGAQLDKIRIFSRTAANGDYNTVNLLDFFNKANPHLLPPLQEGDIIVVPGHPFSLGATDLKVLGEVHNPGPYTAYEGANLLDLIFIAGGPTPEADLRKTSVLSPYSQGPRQKEVNLERLLTAKEVQQIPLINPGDIVYVPKRKSAFGRVLFNVARDIISLGSLVLIIERF